MKLWTIFVKSMLEQVRDIKMLSLVMLSPLFFVLVFWPGFRLGLLHFESRSNQRRQGAVGAGIIENFARGQI